MDTRELIERDARKVLADYYRAGGNGGMADDIMRDNWRIGSSPAETDIVRAIAEALSSQDAEIERLREALTSVGDVHRELQLIDALASDYLTGRILKCREIADAALTPKPNKEG